MPKNNNKFQENEKVLCFHGPLLYEAKVQKSQEKKDNKESKERIVEYYVHYLGWSKNWDEWVPEDRVLKINESSRQKQRELNEAQNKSNKNKSAKKKLIETKDKEMVSSNVSIGTDRPKVKLNSPLILNTVSPMSSETKTNSIAVKDIDSQRKKRIKVEPTVESEDSIATKGQDIQIKIPERLKQYLVDDWELIRQKKLVRLPSKVSVNRIIDDYVKLRVDSKLTQTKESAVREAAEAIKEYFNASVGSLLLYSFETNQYKDLIKDPDEEPKASTIYGGIHLLRLFVKLGSLLSYLNLDEKSVQLISGHIHDFLKYLERNPSLFAPNEYESASDDYLKKLS